MRLGPAHWLATLRARKRALLCALLPAFALTAVSGPACPAMAAPDAAVAAHEHEHSDSHTRHANAAAATTAQPVPPPCPHCPLESGGVNVGHATCTIADAQDGGVKPAQGASQQLPPVLVRDWTLPAARAAPPLIARLPRSPKPLAATVPLNLRHCVFLI